MNNVEAIRKLNEREIELGIAGTSASWHEKYSSSGVVYVGGLQPVLTEGDLLSVFEQYGVIVHVNLVRDGKTRTPRGFAFLDFEDPRSAVLAVDNLNGTQVLGRTIRVDHVEQYTYPETSGGALDVRPPGLAEAAATRRSNFEGEASARILSEAERRDDADKKREAVVMERLRAVQRRRLLEQRAKDHPPGFSERHDERENLPPSEKPAPSSNRKNLPDAPKSREELRHEVQGRDATRREEKLEVLKRKRQRREERALIREERRKRRARRRSEADG